MFKFKETISGCLKNDNKYKEVIYKSFYGYFMGVILRYVKSRDDAQELINDSFIKIFTGLVYFKLPDNVSEQEKAFKGWGAKISANVAIDHLRARKTISDFDIADIAEADEPGAEANIVASLNADDILKMLGQLPDIQNMVFNMYEIEGYKHEEIAQILKIPASSSRVYLTRAKQNIRNLYFQIINESHAAG
jgi:RNA polymerase sigma factor (sigma-70 family)